MVWQSSTDKTSPFHGDMTKGRLCRVRAFIRHGDWLSLEPHFRFPCLLRCYIRMSYRLRNLKAAIIQFSIVPQQKTYSVWRVSVWTSSCSRECVVEI